MGLIIFIAGIIIGFGFRGLFLGKNGYVCKSRSGVLFKVKLDGTAVFVTEKGEVWSSGQCSILRNEIGKKYELSDPFLQDGKILYKTFKCLDS